MHERQPSGFLERAVWWLSRAAMLLSAAIVLVIFYEVIVRYVFFRPTLWAYELSWWLAGVIYLLSGIYVMQQRAHIRITIFYDKLPPFWQQACDVLGWLFLLCFCVAVVWGGYNEAVAKLLRWEGLGSAWNPPIPATLKPLILLTVIAVTTVGLSNLLRDWRADWRRRRHADGDDGDDSSNANGSDAPPR